MQISTSRFLAEGAGWRISDEVCRAGPSDRPFEEQHARFAVSAVLSGTFAYRSSRGRALLSPGSLLLGRRRAQFCCSHDYGCGDRCIAFYFDDEWIEDFARELPGVTSTRLPGVRIPSAQSLARLIADVQALADGRNPGGEEELALRMAEAALVSCPEGPPRIDVTPSDERRIAAALKIIEQNIAEPLSLARLASAVSLSRYHFLRTFVRTTGQTPWQYVLSRRLPLAGRYLSSGSATVLDAALASGFTDLSEFTRRFRLHFGVTPGVYAAMNRASSGLTGSVRARRRCSRSSGKAVDEIGSNSATRSR